MKVNWRSMLTAGGVFIPIGLTVVYFTHSQVANAAICGIGGMIWQLIWPMWTDR